MPESTKCNWQNPSLLPIKICQLKPPPPRFCGNLVPWRLNSLSLNSSVIVSCLKIQEAPNDKQNASDKSLRNSVVSIDEMSSVMMCSTERFLSSSTNFNPPFRLSSLCLGDVTTNTGAPSDLHQRTSERRRLPPPNKTIRSIDELDFC